ncbi:DUF3077 domain-containing protein [Pseudomonas entomophila]|uniref:DUF3077 domain-containing protein n=1 Tax=Pseudomonas entomophila TaxID=312306 RepID=UPI0023D84E6F|nr:DUF3077 domain-containing protein [Pseudomonas entomophila]MDF0732814.1 DUF3077 domain-containing protein [Pseudomonas entomophila]
MELFRVQPGVPFERAFEEVSVLLGCIRHLSEGLEEAPDPKVSGAVHYLSALAKALMNDLEIARNRG